MMITDLLGSVDIRRSDSLIVLNTASKDPRFAAAKLQAITDGYMAIKTQREAASTQIRINELQRRTEALEAELRELDQEKLDVGGEFGADSMAKAHIEKINQIDRVVQRKAEIENTSGQYAGIPTA